MREKILSLLKSILIVLRKKINIWSVKLMLEIKNIDYGVNEIKKCRKNLLNLQDGKEEGDSK